MEIDVRDQDALTYFVSEKLAFAVQKDVLDYDLEEEMVELCRILSTVRDRADGYLVKDLMNDVHHTMEVRDDAIRKTL